MGPRSVERGKQMVARVRAPSAKLQWGRVLLNAESRRNANAPPRPRPASMGPRSVERGKIECLTPVHITELASMGPRSVERGKEVAIKRDGILIVLQWGRVLLNAESRLFADRPGINSPCFNGAAFC